MRQNVRSCMDGLKVTLSRSRGLTLIQQGSKYQVSVPDALEFIFHSDVSNGRRVFASLEGGEGGTQTHDHTKANPADTNLEYLRDFCHPVQDWGQEEVCRYTRPCTFAGIFHEELELVNILLLCLSSTIHLLADTPRKAVRKKGRKNDEKTSEAKLHVPLYRTATSGMRDNGCIFHLISLMCIDNPAASDSSGRTGRPPQYKSFRHGKA